MDRCLTDEPALVPVGDASGHRSACWLPATAIGLTDDAEHQRTRAVELGRTGRAAQVAEAIAAAP